MGMMDFSLKEISKEIAKPLGILYRQSLIQDAIPDDWSSANVLPLFKKGSRRKPSNYCPVSLTSVVCKVLESIIRDEIVKHLDKYDLIQARNMDSTKEDRVLQIYYVSWNL